MALLFMDSWDHYVTADLTEKWTTSAGATIAAAAGRRGSGSLQFGTSSSNRVVSKGLPASGPTAIIGVAWKASAFTGTLRLCGVWDGATTRNCWYLQVNTDGSVAMYRGATTTAAPPGGGTTDPGTLLGTPSAAGVLSAGVVAYLEVKVLMHASAGTATVRINGAAVLTLTGLNTSNAGTAWTSAWLTGLNSSGVSVTFDFDDLYVLDGSGAAPWNDFLGDCRVDARYPTGAGATTGWTPSAGANWAAVDETAPNDDTDYVAAAAAGVTDTYVVQDAPVTGAAIYGVQHVISMKKTDAGAASVAPVIRHSGVDYPGAAINPGTAYAYGVQIAAVNPGTASAWTEAGFNAAEFGVTRTV